MHHPSLFRQDQRIALDFGVQIQFHEVRNVFNALQAPTLQHILLLIQPGISQVFEGLVGPQLYIDIGHVLADAGEVDDGRWDV